MYAPVRLALYLKMEDARRNRGYIPSDVWSHATRKYTRVTYSFLPPRVAEARGHPSIHPDHTRVSNLPLKPAAPSVVLVSHVLFFLISLPIIRKFSIIEKIARPYDQVSPLRRPEMATIRRGQLTALERWNPEDYEREKSRRKSWQNLGAVTFC